jgi:S-adenosylmethionine:tRNA ribosyltransferase-isomerase
MTLAVDFELPVDLEAVAPPERRGVGRNGVRMMVGWRSSGMVLDQVFADLVCHLGAGDVLVVNTSRTLPAAVPALTRDGVAVLVHFSAPLAPDQWTVEVRSPIRHGSRQAPPLEAQSLALPAGARAVLRHAVEGAGRLWVADLVGTGEVVDYLAAHGRPVRYAYAGGEWPLSDYQTVYARQPGSAEMPSAGRPFTAELITALVAKGVLVVPVVLHTGLASLEAGDRPQPEWFEVSASTAATVTTARAGGGRVVAVGTSVVRALESASDGAGGVAATTGMTDHVVTGGVGVAVVDGLITGWHEPRASHLDLVEAVAGPELTGRLYQHALDQRYLWHEFGDSCLILP